MLALSNPDPALAFPVGTTLHPQLFVRNTTAKPIDASLVFNWRSDTATGKSHGPSLRLSPYETLLIDVAALQDGTVLPKDANWTSLTLTTNSLPDEVMAVAASYDATLQYGAQTPFTDQLAHHWVGSMWEYDALHDSIITVGNGGTKPTQTAFTLVYNQGTQKYDLEQTLQPGEQMWIDVGKLIREKIPDKNGKTLPAALTSGSYEIRDLTNKGVGTLFEGKIIFDRTYGHVTYGCNSCCGYKTPRLFFDPLGIPLGFASNQGVEAIDTCTGRTEDITGDFDNAWSTANTSIATVDSYGTHTGVSEGSTTTSTCADLPVFNPLKLCPVNTLCPGGGDNVNPSVQITGASKFAFVGSNPTIPKVLQQAVGKPGGGTYSWSVSPTGRISFDNPSSAIVQMSGINPSTYVGDTTLTVTYSVNNQSPTATSTATSRIFVYVAANTQISVPPPSGKYGYDYRLTYDTYTCPGSQILQSGFSGISVPESFSVSRTNIPGATTHTGTGATDANSEFTDRLALISNNPIPPSVSEVDTQEIFVGGIFVRNNTLTYSATTVTVTNNGTYSCTH